jgi:putative ABC transport system permease protein
MPALRALGRVAWRDIARHRGRSLLVVFLIALPVAAMVAGIALLRTTQPTQALRDLSQFGRADLVAQGLSRAELDPYLPAGSVVEPMFAADGQILVDGARPSTTVRGVALDGLAQGMLTLLDGRAPKGRNEVAISREVARIAKASIGGSVTIDDAPPATVVGLVENALNLGDRVVVEDPFAVQQSDPTFGSWLVAVPPGADPDAVVAATYDPDTGLQKVSLYSRASGMLQIVGSDQRSMILALGSLALVEAALVASAAFAVSIRRRQREVGLLAASGATPEQLSASVLAGAAMLGLVACVVGVAGGLVVTFGMSPFLDQLTQRRNPPIVLDASGLVIPVLIGFVAALIAAVVPARTVARVPVLLSLSGRRPPEASARKTLRLGLAVVAISVALALIGANARSRPFTEVRELLVIAGAVLGTLGFGACGPWLLERLETVAARLPLATRIAFRDTSRARSRNSPIVTAVLASVAATITIGTFTVSRNAANASEWRPYLHQDELVVRGAASDEVGRELATSPGAIGGVATSYLVAGEPDGDEAGAGGGVRVIGNRDRQLSIELPGARDPGGKPLRWGDAGQYVPTAESASRPSAELLDLAGAQGAKASLDAGNIVILWPDPMTTATADVVISTFDGLNESVQRKTYPATVVSTGITAGVLPGALIPQSIADELGLHPVDAQQFVVRYDHAVTQADVDAAAAVAGRRLDTFVDASLGPQRPDESFRVLLVALALLFALSVTGVAIALGEAESRPEQRSLLALGADPRLRRRIIASRAAVLALLAGLLALPAGLLPAWSLLASVREPFAVPTPEILAAVAGLPIVAVVGAWLLSRPIPDWNAFRSVRAGE